jgi:hypothetical protein
MPSSQAVSLYFLFPTSLPEKCYCHLDDQRESGTRVEKIPRLESTIHNLNGISKEIISNKRHANLNCSMCRSITDMIVLKKITHIQSKKNMYLDCADSFPSVNILASASLVAGPSAAAAENREETF